PVRARAAHRAGRRSPASRCRWRRRRCRCRRCLRGRCHAGGHRGVAMMAPVADPRHGRLLAIMLVLIALLLGYLLFVHWTLVAPHMQLRSQLIDLREQEQRLRSSAAQRQAIEERLAEVRAFEAQNPGFLEEASFDLATAGLMQRLELE